MQDEQTIVVGPAKENPWRDGSVVFWRQNRRDIYVVLIILLIHTCGEDPMEARNKSETNYKRDAETQQRLRKMAFSLFGSLTQHALTFLTGFKRGKNI